MDYDRTKFMMPYYATVLFNYFMYFINHKIFTLDSILRDYKFDII